MKIKKRDKLVILYTNVQNNYSLVYNIDKP